MTGNIEVLIHSSIRITDDRAGVIYIDPYAGEGYDIPADLILGQYGLKLQQTMHKQTQIQL